MKNSFPLDPGKTESNDCETKESKDIFFFIVTDSRDILLFLLS